MTAHVSKLQKNSRDQRQQVPYPRSYRRRIVAALLSVGKTQAEAKLQLTIAKGLGSSVLVETEFGNEYLKLREEDKNES